MADVAGAVVINFHVKHITRRNAPGVQVDQGIRADCCAADEWAAEDIKARVLNIHDRGTLSHEIASNVDVDRRVGDVPSPVRTNVSDKKPADGNAGDIQQQLDIRANGPAAAAIVPVCRYEARVDRRDKSATDVEKILPPESIDPPLRLLIRASIEFAVRSPSVVRKISPPTPI